MSNCKDCKFWDIHNAIISSRDEYRECAAPLEAASMVYLHPHSPGSQLKMPLFTGEKFGCVFFEAEP